MFILSLTQEYRTNSINYELTPWSKVLIKKVAYRHSASQTIPHLLWNLKIHYCVHKGQNLSLSHINLGCHISLQHEKLEPNFKMGRRGYKTLTMQEKEQFKNPEQCTGTVPYTGMSCKVSPWSHKKSACVSLNIYKELKVKWKKQPFKNQVL